MHTQRPRLQHSHDSQSHFCVVLPSRNMKHILGLTCASRGTPKTMSETHTRSHLCIVLHTQHQFYNMRSVSLVHRGLAAIARGCPVTDTVDITRHSQQLREPQAGAHASCCHTNWPEGHPCPDKATQHPTATSHHDLIHCVVPQHDS